MTKKYLEKSIARYIRVTKHFLHCPKNYRDHFIQDMEHDIAQFLLENHDTKYSDIIRYFGTPSELAQIYLDNVPTEELALYKTNRKLFYTLSVVILITMPVPVTIYLYLSLQKIQKEILSNIVEKN